MLKSALIGLLAVMPMLAAAIEEPSYEVVRQLDGAELRQYAPYVVAQVLVSGPADQAGSTAFPILAGYIFGKNKGARKLEMTAPVTQAASPVKLEMTAPVTQAAAPGGYVVQFVLPQGLTLDSAPERLRVFRSCPLITPKDAQSSLQMLAIARAMAALCA